MVIFWMLIMNVVCFGAVQLTSQQFELPTQWTRASHFEPPAQNNGVVWCCRDAQSLGLQKYEILDKQFFDCVTLSDGELELAIYIDKRLSESLAFEFVLTQEKKGVIKLMKQYINKFLCNGHEELLQQRSVSENLCWYGFDRESVTIERFLGFCEDGTERFVQLSVPYKNLREVTVHEVVNNQC